MELDFFGDARIYSCSRRRIGETLSPKCTGRGAIRRVWNRHRERAHLLLSSVGEVGIAITTKSPLRILGTTMAIYILRSADEIQMVRAIEAGEAAFARTGFGGID